MSSVRPTAARAANDTSPAPAGRWVLPSNASHEAKGGSLRDNVRLVFTFIGCLVLGAAAAATADAIVNPNGSSNGPVAGGLVAGFGLSLVLIARLRD
jgi:hypothetical protein